MENEIKKLIDIYKARIKFNVAVHLVIEDLESLLKLYQSQCEVPEPKMPTIGENIKAVYERFKHFEILLNDPVWMNSGNDKIYDICYELWKAVKNAQNV